MAETITVPVAEAQERLPDLLSAVERGHDVRISRDDGVPVARIVREASAPLTEEQRARAREAIEGIKRLSKGLSLGGLKIKDLINERRP